MKKQERGKDKKTVPLAKPIQEKEEVSRAAEAVNRPPRHQEKPTKR